MVVGMVISIVILSCNICVDHQGRKIHSGKLETVGEVIIMCICNHRSLLLDMLGQQCCMMLASFEQAFRLQQRDANTKESKDTVLESDDFPLRRSPFFFNNIFVITRFTYPC